MKRIEYFELFAKLFTFKKMLDDKGNEYVLLSTSELKEIKNIEDKTAFEALENHVHLVNNLKKEEFERLIPVAKIFAKILAHLLKQQFPDKNFYTYVSLHLKDSMIIRFHQKWENEEPYCDPMDFSGEIEKVFMYQI